MKWHLTALPSGSSRTLIAGLAGLGLVGVGVWWTLRGPTETGGPESSGSPARTQSATRAGDDRSDRAQRDAAMRGHVTLSEAVAMCDRWDIPRLTREQIETYLNQRGRTTSSLLAAANLIEGPELLIEAAKQSPSDPRVLLALALQGNGNLSRQAALDAFRAAAPDNALGDYLHALAAFNSGRPDDALAGLAEATAKPGFESFSHDTRDEMERMFRSSGFSPQAARVVAMFRDSQAGNLALAGLGKHLGGEIARALRRNDDARAVALAQQGLVLADRIRRTDTLLARMAATTQELAVLGTLPPATVIEPGGPTAGERLDQCRNTSVEIENLASMAGHLADIPAGDAERYYDLAWQEGEFQAARWLKAKLAGTDAR